MISRILDSAIRKEVVVFYWKKLQKEKKILNRDLGNFSDMLDLVLTTLLRKKLYLMLLKMF